MLGKKFQISRQWHDIIEYSEGEDRSIQLDCPSLVEPPTVTVPSPARWAAEMPDWLRERREEVVARLQAWGAMVAEEIPDTDDYSRVTRIPSPDGTFRVEQIWTPDERAPDYQRVRVVAEPRGRVLADLHLYEVSGDIRFPGPGRLILPLRHRNGKQVQAHIDVVGKTFVFHPAEQEQPLTELFAQLNDITVARRLVRGPAGPVGWRRCLGDMAMAVIGTLFVPAGLMISIVGKTPGTRLIGAGVIVFFGACAVVPMIGPQRRIPRFAPYLPLVAVLAEVPWLIFLLLAVLFIVGDAPVSFTREQELAGDALAVFPSCFGLIWAAVGMIRGVARGLIGAISLMLGGLACLAVVGWYVWDLFN